MDKKVCEKVKYLCGSKQDGHSLTSLIHLKAPHLSLQEVNKFNQLFREMKNGKNNGEERCAILNNFETVEYLTSKAVKQYLKLWKICTIGLYPRILLLMFVIRR